MTVKEQLEQVQRQIGRNLPELEGPDFPSLMCYVWSAFLQLNETRTAGQVSANPISFTEIEAYLKLSNNRLSARDVEALRKVDKVYLEIMNG